jgi:hypothetical protein
MAPKTLPLLQAIFLLLLVVLLSFPHSIQSKLSGQSKLFNFIQCSEGSLSSNGQDVSELKFKEFVFSWMNHSGFIDSKRTNKNDEFVIGSSWIFPYFLLGVVLTLA